MIFKTPFCAKTDFLGSPTGILPKIRPLKWTKSGGFAFNTSLLEDCDKQDQAMQRDAHNDEPEEALRARIHTLEQQLNEYKNVDEESRERRTRIAKAAALTGARVLGGNQLYQKILQAWNAWVHWTDSDHTQPWPKRESGELLAALLNRLLRIGVIAFTLALIPSGLLIIQTTLLKKQNEKIELQSSLIETQNRLIEGSRRAALSFELTAVQDRIADEVATFWQSQELYFQENYSTLLKQARGAYDSELHYTQKDRRFESLTEAEKLHAVRSHFTRSSFRLSPFLSGRIVALSRSLRPYSYLQGNGTLSATLSPERGHLLLAYLYSESQRSIRFGEMNFNHADLPGADLEGRDLIGAQLSHANLEGASLRASILTRARFEGANLQNADFDESDLSHASLKNANLQNVDLDSTDLSGADLTGADLRCANLYGIKFDDGTSFRRSKLSGGGVLQLNGINAEAADLSNGFFVISSLEKADLSGANLRETIMVAVDLREAVVSGITGWESPSPEFLELTRDFRPMSGVNIWGIVDPPPGFREWAVDNGAVEFEDQEQWMETGINISQLKAMENDTRLVELLQGLRRLRGFPARCNY